MKRRWLAILTAMILTVVMSFGLTGCGGGGEEELAYEGEWVSAGILKAGLPSGWINDEERQKADDEAGEYELLFRSNDNNDDSTIMIFMSAKRVPRVGEDTGYQTLKEVALTGLAESDREDAEFTTQEIGGLTYGRIDMTEHISKDKEIRLFYKSGTAKKENGDYDSEYTTCTVRVVGPFGEDQETVDAVLDSIRLDLGSEYDDVKNGLEAEPTADEPAGVLDLTGATIEPPKGWNVKSQTETNIELTNVDVLRSSVRFTYKTQTQSAKDWASDYDKNYGGGHEIDQVKIGDNTFYHLKASDSQEFLLIDGKGSGTVIEVNCLFCTVDEAKSAVETLKLK